jgi:hypothetical protein
MNDPDSRTELQRLEAEYPSLVKLLRRTPPPPEADTGNSAGEDLLAARALSILGSAAGRNRSAEDGHDIVLTSQGLQALVGGLGDALDQRNTEIEKLREEIVEIRHSQMTADSVRVIAAKVLAAIVVSLSALIAIIAAIIEIA